MSAAAPSTLPNRPDSPGMSPPPSPSPAVLRSRWLALGCAVLLVVLGLLWELVWARTGSGTLALKVVPMALALPGLWRMRLYTYRWLSLALWLYAADGAMRLRDPGLSSVLAWSELLLSIALFVACAWHVRARLAAGRALQAAQTAATEAAAATVTATVATPSTDTR